MALSAMQKSIRRGDSLTAQRALRTLYQHDPSSTWRRLLIIACEDVGIGELGTVIITAARSANTKTLREMGRDEAAALATAQMLDEAPKDRSANLLFAVALHDPALASDRGVDPFRSLGGSNSS
jgi:replication-associated recombination protein RarA